MSSVKKINKKLFYKIIIFCSLFLLILLPDGIKNMFRLYTMTTKDLSLVYTYNYYFSIFDFVVIILGLYYYKKSGVLRCIHICTAIIIINLIRWVLGVSNVVDLESYEMILILLEAVCWSSIVLRIFKTDFELELLLNIMPLMIFLTQILQFVLGNYTDDGRIAAISLSPGSTAEFYSLYDIWFLLCYKKKKKNYCILILTFIGLLLTGGRSPILFVLAISLISIVNVWKTTKESKTQGKFLFLVGLISLGVFFAFLYGGNLGAINRISSFLQGNIYQNYLGDSSSLGRMRSITGGFEIWKENPYGISCSIYDLEYRSCLKFQMEYPHSSFLSYILIWSPFVAFYIIIYLIRTAIKLLSNKDSAFLIISFMIFKFIFISTPCLYVPQYALYIIYFTYFDRKATFYSKNNKSKFEDFKGGLLQK